MNIATTAMNKLTKMLLAVDGKMNKFATEPYGMKKLTEKQQWERYKSLTPEQMFENIQNMNYKEFADYNKWLYRMEKKEEND